MRKSSLLIFVLLCGCHKDMAVQPKFKSEGRTSLFADQRMTRPAPVDTVAVDAPVTTLEKTARFESGLQDGQPVNQIQVPLTIEALRRGRERYSISCVPCHDQAGGGDGIVVQRGFPRPKPLTDESVVRLRDGEIFRQITFGVGAMASEINLISAVERWQVVAYVRALQLSRNVPAVDLSEDDRQHLSKTSAAEER